MDDFQHMLVKRLDEIYAEQQSMNIRMTRVESKVTFFRGASYAVSAIAAIAGYFSGLYNEVFHK